MVDGSTVQWLDDSMVSLILLETSSIQEIANVVEKISMYF
jgi:hypothetical protein